MQKLANFYADFGAYLRTQQAGGNRRTQLYQQLVANNIKGFVDACMPLAKIACNQVQEGRFDKIFAHFLANASPSSPYFSEIGQEFLAHLYAMGTHALLQDLPPWWLDLADFECQELVVECMPDRKSVPLYAQVHINGEVMALHYSYDVLNIAKMVRENSADAVDTQESFYLLYRAQNQVRALPITPMTYLLVEFLQNLTARFDDEAALLTAFFKSVGVTSDSQMIGFGKSALLELQQEGVLINQADKRFL